MTIIASATVPAHSRLADVDTAQFPTVPAPTFPNVPAVPALQLGLRAYNIVSRAIEQGIDAPTLAEMTDLLGVTEDQARDGVIAFVNFWARQHAGAR